MMSNILRRVTGCCRANIQRCSQITDNSAVLTRLVTLHTYSPRFLSEKRPENTTDEVTELLGQMQLAAENMSDLPDIFEDGEYDNVDEPQTDETSLPGYRIRGILVPTAETLNALVGGQLYEKLPIAHVHASYQNTIIVITDYKGSTVITNSSGGMVGFKNAKKRTAVASHTAAISAGQKAVIKGVTHVRVALRGRGQGRLSACKGFEEAGLKVVSISDVSVINWGTHFARKRRRL